MTDNEKGKPIVFIKRFYQRYVQLLKEVSNFLLKSHIWQDLFQVGKRARLLINAIVSVQSNCQKRCDI